jgi:glycosyltransferase involved in cell wall biosynthesis
VFGSRRKGWQEGSVNKFFELHQNRPFDVIWSQSFDAFGLTRLNKNFLKPPVIPTLHGSIQQEAKTFRTNFSQNLMKPQRLFSSFAGLFYSYFIAQRPLLSFSDKIITVSHQVTEDLRKWYGQKIVKKCITVFNGIDTSLFKPDNEQRSTIRQKYKISDNDILLLTVGRITYEKGHHLAIEALRQLKNQDLNVRLMIVGEGEGRRILEENVRMDGLEQEVIFTGQVDNTETVQYYNSADIFLMPTLTVEGLPFVLLEAMACAKPVIASDIGGNAEVINDGENGILIKPGQPQLIADHIRMLIADRPYATRLGEGGLATVINGFNMERMIDRTEQVMIEVVNAATSR